MESDIIRNTKNSGRARVFMYPQGDIYIGVCLDFDLVVEARTYLEADDLIKDAVESHLNTVIDKKLSDDLLNRPAPKEYWDKYKEYLEHEKRLASSRGEITPGTNNWANLAFLQTLNLGSPRIARHYF